MGMYDETTPAVEATATAAADTPASRLYSTDAKPVARSADEPIDRRLFGDTTFMTELPDGAIADFDSKAGREVAQDIGAESADVSHFVSLARQPAPTAEQHAEWRSAAETMLKDREFTPADMELARRFVAADKRLFAALDSGLGSHPQVVERVVLLARSARNAGRFK